MAETEKATGASLPTATQASYVVIIDSILAASDLNTISAKRVRKGLQNAVDYDISFQKDAINDLIMQRFDKFHNDVAVKAEPDVKGEEANIKPALITPAVPQTNGTSSHAPIEKKSETTTVSPAKRKASSSEADLLSISNGVTPSPKKKPKPTIISSQRPAKSLDMDHDAAFAAKLQAEENNRARPTRGGGSKPTKKAPVKKKTKKKKTSENVKAEDDSDIEGTEDAEKERKVNRNTGFHKLLNLSPSLSALLGGEAQLSRPQTVKKVWQHIKANELQDPADKRMIICDDQMRAVFKTDKIQMFTMNKVLNQNLYNPDE